MPTKPAQTTPDYAIKQIGQNRGKPRIWLEGPMARRTGFKPGEKILISVKGRAVVVERHPEGEYTLSPDEKSLTVSGRDDKDGARTLPLIDINDAAILKVFEGMSAVRLMVGKGKAYFLPLASEIKRVERITRTARRIQSGEPLLIGSAFTGGGTMLNAFKKGLERASLNTKTAFVSEIGDHLVAQMADHNDAVGMAALLNAPIQELVQDELLMNTLPAVDVMEMGIPCSGASKAGLAKKAGEARKKAAAEGRAVADLEKTIPEMHEQVGHLVFSALAIINRCNPTVLVIENVPNYATTASAWILRHQLRDMGYDTHEAILNSRDFGSPEGRDRFFMVGVTRGISFSFEQFYPKPTVIRQVKDYLDTTIAPDDERWNPFEYLKTKAIRDKADGKGFAMQIIDPESTKIPTIRKDYNKGGSTDPLVPHPTNPDLLRKLTGDEHCAIKGHPRELLEGLSETEKHQLLGQGITFEVVAQLGEHTGETLLDNFKNRSAQILTDGAHVTAAKAKITG